jgi:hypothetical protein
MEEWPVSINNSILSDQHPDYRVREKKCREAYRFYGVNVVLVFISQGFDTFDGFFTSNKLIETFNFAIGDFLALGTQIGNASIDLQRSGDTNEMRLRCE